MDRVLMTLHGAAELEAALRELPFRLAKSTLRRALLLAAVPMVDAARANAPTNRLKARTQLGSQLSRRQRAQAGRGQRGPKSGTYTVLAYVGQRPSRHAHLLEFGSGPRYNKKGQYRGVMPITPFLRPAFDSTAPEVLNRFGRILGVEIERAAVRLRKRKLKAASSAAIAANKGV